MDVPRRGGTRKPHPVRPQRPHTTPHDDRRFVAAEPPPVGAGTAATVVCDPHHIPRVGPTRGAAQADPSPAAAPAVIEGRARFARPQTDEAYFVCPRGLHRVYHGALMDLLRDEDYTPYRHAIHSALEYDPAIQERDVSGMNNPDEETAAEKFGAGEQCVGIARLLSTLPTPPPQGERDPGTEDHPT